MKLLRAEIANFKCFKNLEVDFPSQNGFFLLTGTNLETPALGSNGLGKSSLFAAVCWCLYGVTEKKQKAGKLLNRTSKGGYAVVLFFEKDGVEHRLVRTWNPNGLQLDGKAIKDEEAVDFIGLTYEQFLYAVYFAQSGTSFIDLSPTDKLTFLSTLFQLEKWTACSEKCKQKLQTVMISLAKVQSDHANTQTTIDQLNGEIPVMVEKEQLWGAQRDVQITELQAQAETIANTVEVIPDAPVYVAMLKDIQAEEKINAAERANSQKELIQVNKEIGVTDHKIAHFISQLEDLTGKENTPCAQCTQIIPSEYIASVTDSMFQNTEQLQVHLENLKAHLMVCTAIKASLDEKGIAITKELNEVQNELDTVATKKAAEEAKKTQVRYFEQQARKKAQEINPYTTEIALVADKRDKAVLRLLEFSKEQLALEKQQAQFEFWKVRFPQLRLSILNEVTQELELHFNQALGTMGLVDWWLTISTERPLKDESIKNELTMKLLNGKEEVDLDSLSGGERQRIRVCTNIGISDLIKSRCGISFDLLLFDEPCASLSQEGIENLLGMLEALSEVQKVFLAEHRVLELSRFNSTYFLTKGVDGNSELKVS